MSKNPVERALSPSRLLLRPLVVVMPVDFYGQAMRVDGEIHAITTDYLLRHDQKAIRQRRSGDQTEGQR
jgi:hypothetical protein